MNWIQQALAINQLVPSVIQLIEVFVLLFKKQNPTATVTSSDKKAAAVNAVLATTGAPADASTAVGDLVDAHVAINNANGVFTHQQPAN